MQLKTHCPKCQKALRCPEERINSVVRCPACRHKFRVSSASAGSRSGEIQASQEVVGSIVSEDFPGTSREIESQDQLGATGPRRAAGDAQPSPSRFAHFELQKLLGGGGFGLVYRAWDSKLGRQVALKVPRFEMTDDRRLRRFRQEARTAAKLHHPNIVVVLEEGQQGDKPFIVSEFVDGETLSSRMENDRPDFRTTVQWVRDLANALAYAHELGVIHRDIKPDNIMLGSHGRPQIMDFGLAKQLQDDSSLSIDGSVLGTPNYMAPEQARGEITKLDGRTDQYSLGVVFYELLTGQKPFSGSTHLVMAQVADPRRESPRPRSVESAIPKDLEAVCQKAMSKDPADRYADLTEMAADLDRWLEGKPTQARPVNTPEQAWRWCRRNPALATLSSIATVAFLIALSFGWSLLQQDARRTTDSDFDEAPTSDRRSGADSSNSKIAPVNANFEGTAKSSEDRNKQFAATERRNWEGWPLNAPAPAIAPFDAEQAKRHQKEWAEYLDLPVKRQIELPGKESLSLVLIPPGEFLMGSSDGEQTSVLNQAELDQEEYQDWQDSGSHWVGQEGPQVKVTIDHPFYLGRTEVTTSQWNAVMEREQQGKPQTNIPIEGVSFIDVANFMKKMNSSASNSKISFTLPPESCWEYACRAGTETAWHFGDSPEEAAQFAWTWTNSGGELQGVAQLHPNPWGLWDMHGNAREWCSNPAERREPTWSRIDINDNPDPGYDVIMRSGSAQHTTRRSRSSSRLTNAPSDKKRNGFRVAMTIPDARPSRDELRFPAFSKWSKGRKELTVAQDGSGMFTSIQDALDAQEHGEVVRILDRGPYRESLKWGDRRNCGLVSTVGTIIEPQDWTVFWQSGDQTRKLAHNFSGLTDCRVSGFVFASNNTVTDSELLMQLIRCPGICIERCVFIGNSDPVTQHSLRLTNSKSGVTAPCLRENAFLNTPIQVFCEGDYGAKITRNWIRLRNPGAFKNSTAYGIYIQDIDPQNDPKVEIANNVVDITAGSGNCFAVHIESDRGLPIYFWSNTVRQSFAGSAGCLMFRVRGVPGNDVVVQGNVDSTFRHSIYFSGDESKSFVPIAEKRWVMDRNYSNAAFFENAAHLPIGQPTADPITFLSPDPTSADFGRIDPTSIPVSPGEPFPGALSPGPAPPGGDWFTGVQERFLNGIRTCDEDSRYRWTEEMVLAIEEGEQDALVHVEPAASHNTITSGNGDLWMFPATSREADSRVQLDGSVHGFTIEGESIALENSEISFILETEDPEKSEQEKANPGSGDEISIVTDDKGAFSVNGLMPSPAVYAMRVMADHHLTVSGRISCKPSDNADPIKVTMEPRSRFEIESIPLVHSRFSHDRIRREVLYVGDKWFPFGEVPGDLSEQFSEFANSKYFVRTSGSTAEDRGLSFSPYFGGSWWREQGNGELQDFVQVRLASGKTGPKSGNGSQSTSSSRSQVVPGRVYLLCLSEKDAAYVLFKVRRFDSPADDLISSTYSNSRFRHASEADPLVRQELDLAVGKARDRLSRINGSYASIAMHVETERIDGESPRDVKYQCFDVNSNKRAPKHKLSEWKPLKRNTPFTGLERISQEQEQWIVIFAGPQHELFWHKTRLTPGEVTDLGHLVLKKSPSTSTVSVRGIVEDVHGAPLSGALVTAGTREDRSDNGGRYQIDQVEPGAFDVNATLDGFFCNPKQWTVQDARDSVVDVDIVMYRPHRVALRYAITSDPNGRFSKEGNEQHSIEFLMLNERVYFKRGLVLRTPKEWQSLPAPWIQFAFAARPSMQFSGDGIQFRGSYCRFSKLEGGLDLFNSIKSVQELQSWRVSRSSDLQEGDVLLVRHQPSTSDSGNKGFALKVFVEKFESVDVTE